jgi:hypothetical protein
MTTKPSGLDTPGIDLDQVRNTGDAAVWLHQEAARHAAEAKTQPSPVQARALRGTGSTLEVYAAVIGTYRDTAGIGAELARLADDYRHPDRDAVEPVPEVHRLVCDQLGSTLGELAVRLLHLARTEPHRPHVGPAADRPIDL